MSIKQKEEQTELLNGFLLFLINKACIDAPDLVSEFLDQSKESDES